MLRITLLRYNHGTPALIKKVVFVQSEEELDNETRVELNRVAESMYNVIKEIKNKNDFYLPVIVEHHPTLERDSLSECLIEQTFHNHFPSEYGELNFEQKVCIITVGVGRFLVNSRIISKVYSDDLQCDNNRDKIYSQYGLSFQEDVSFFSMRALQSLYNNFITDTEIRRSAALYQKREYLTYKKAVSTAHELERNNIIIIYGGLHYFEDLSALFPSTMLVTKDYDGKDESLCQYYNKLRVSRPIPQLSVLEGPWEYQNSPKNFSITSLLVKSMSLLNCCKRRNAKVANYQNLSEEEQKKYDYSEGPNLEL